MQETENVNKAAAPSGIANKLILTAIASMFVTMATLHWYGFLNHSDREDGVVLGGFSMVINVPDMDQYISAKPAKQTAICAQGILILQSAKGMEKNGVLVDDKRRAVRCAF